MWDLPGPGIEPLSPALAGGFLSTAPPGKSLSWTLKNILLTIILWRDLRVQALESERPWLKLVVLYHFGIIDPFKYLLKVLALFPEKQTKVQT